MYPGIGNKSVITIQKRFTALLIILLLLFIINSCQYTPTGVNYVNITPEKPVAYMNLDFAVDTIKIWGTKYLNYWVDIGKRNADAVNLYIDNKLFFSSRVLIDSVLFNSGLYANSTHKLKIEVIANSGTGSISDVLGVEKVIFSKEWTLIIANQQPSPLKILSATPLDGRLKVEWEKYNYFNFQSYYLFKNNIKVAEFDDKGLNYWIDSEYVCGSADYRVDIKAANNVCTGINFNYSDNYSNIIDLAITDSNKVRVTWSKNVFYNNFGSYAVYRGPDYEGKLISVLKNINDTTFLDEDPLFGSEIKYSIGAYPPGYTDYSGFPRNEGEKLACFIGGRILTANYIRFVPSSNSIYLINPTVIQRLDANSYSVSASQGSIAGSGELEVSPNGQFIYVTGEAEFIKLNPLTLAVEKYIPTKSILGYNSYILFGFQVTDSNFIAYPSYAQPTTFGGTGKFIGGDKLICDIIINMNDNSVIDSTITDESDFTCNIADNYKYFYTNGFLYSIMNNKLIKNGYVSGSQFSFIGDGERYVTEENNTLYINKSSDMGTIVSINIAQPANYFYDSVTDCIGIIELINNEYYFTIFNTQTGDEVKKIHISNSYGYYFANSTLFSYEGYYLPLNIK